MSSGRVEIKPRVRGSILVVVGAVLIASLAQPAVATTQPAQSANPVESAVTVDDGVAQQTANGTDGNGSDSNADGSSGGIVGTITGIFGVILGVIGGVLGAILSFFVDNIIGQAIIGLTLGILIGLKILAIYIERYEE